MSRSTVPVIVVLAAASSLAGCGHVESQAANRTGTPIEIESARMPEELATYRGPGTVQAAHTYRVAFEIPGRIASVGADVGDRVAAGSVLATIDASDYRAQYAAALARASVADASALKAHTGARPQEREQAEDGVAAQEAALARAIAARDLANRNDERAQRLAADGDIAVAQADGTHTALVDAEAQVRAAQAELESARQSLALVRSGTRAEDVRAADGDDAAAQANVALARVTLDKSTIVAPADSFVQSRSVELGESAQPGVTAFTLSSSAEPDVVVNVPESRIPQLAVGTSATIRSGTATVHAQVSRIEPTGDSSTHSALVRLHPIGARLQPGSVVDVAIGARSVRGASVSVGALVARDGSTSIDVYDAAHATVIRKPVTIVDTDGENAIVTGIAPGERIVVAGQHDVVPGDPVRVVER
jgi:multidrug resistance efflux pump